MYLPAFQELISRDGPITIIDMESRRNLIPALPKARNAKSVQPQRLRAASSRSRNGCTTCHNRHVKCDERTPICDRCARGWFNCVYKAKSRPRTTTTTRPILPAAAYCAEISPHGHLRPSMTSLAGNDIIYFDLYRYEVVHDIAGIGYSEFWTRTVMRHGVTEGAIQYSILAIGALSMALEGRQVILEGSRHIPKDKGSSECHLQAALRWHAKALVDFRKNMFQAEDTIYPRTMLLTTMMLVAFEVLLGNCANAALLLIRFHEVLTLQVATTSEEISASSITSSNPEDVRTIADIWHMLPRLALINNVIPLLPPENCFKLLSGEATTLEIPKPTDSLKVLYRSWKEFCFAKIQLNGEAQRAEEQKDKAALPHIEARLFELLDKAISWGNITSYHMLRETDDHHLRNLRKMRIQQLALMAIRRDQQQTQIIDIIRHILALCDEIFAASSTSCATRFQMEAIISPILACVVSGRDAEIREDALQTARKYARDKSGNLKASWTAIILALKSDSADPSGTLNILGESAPRYNDVIDNWWHGTDVLLRS